MDKFHANLEEASRAEVSMVKYLEKQGYKAWLNPEKNGDCDIYFIKDGRQLSLEVKTDYHSIVSDLVAIEPQTLEHTKADWFVYLIPQVKFYTTAEIRNLHYEYYESGKNGGDQNKRLALVPKDKFL